MKSQRPLFDVSVVTSEGNDPLPGLFSNDPNKDSFLVGHSGIAYKVRILWSGGLNLGPCQFRLSIDGNFVGYTRVRDLGMDEEDFVEFDGFMVNKGEARRGSKIVEYRKFEFSDPSISQHFQDNGPVSPDNLGHMGIEVYRFQKSSSWGHSCPKTHLWGSIASDGCGMAPLPDSKDIFNMPSLATKPGEKFLKRISFFGKRLCPGRKVGDPLFQMSLRYATVGALVKAGILKNGVHRDIIQWGLKYIPDSEGLLLGPIAVKPEAQDQPPEVIEIIDDTWGDPILYTYPAESCDLTGCYPVWSQLPPTSPEVVSLLDDEDEEDIDMMEIE